MFTNLAQFRLSGIGRAQQARSTIGHRPDGYPDNHLVADSQRARRPALVCHWQTVPSTGALECVWRAAEPPTTNQARPIRLTARAGSPADALAAVEPRLLRPAA
jgi:hypothetical protein